MQDLQSHISTMLKKMLQKREAGFSMLSVYGVQQRKAWSARYVWKT